MKRKLKSADTAPLENFTKLQLELTAKNELIRTLEDRILFLEEEVEELKRAKNEEKITKKDSKTYSTDMRMMIYDAIVNQVPTQNMLNGLVKSLVQFPTEPQWNR